MGRMGRMGGHVARMVHGAQHLHGPHGSEIDADSMLARILQFLQVSYGFDFNRFKTVRTVSRGMGPVSAACCIQLGSQGTVLFLYLTYNHL